MIRGWRIAQAGPSTVCLYRTEMSRQIRKASSSRCAPHFLPVDADPSRLRADHEFRAIDFMLRTGGQSGSNVRGLAKGH